jgi:hypothetical protein
VLGKEHKLDDKELKLSQASSPKPAASSTSVSAVENEQDLKTVSVKGLDINTTSDDTLYNYFENKKRSGGGDVEDIRRDKKTGTFYVTFEECAG